MSVNRYTTPTRVVERPQPFLLPAEQMFKVLAQRQQQYDSLTTALSGLDQGWAGQTARYQRDQNYLTQKRQEVNDFITGLEGQDLTRVPNLKSKILAIASDPTLSIIKANNEYYDKMQEVVDAQKRSNAYSPANAYPVELSIEEYNSKNAPPEFFAVQSPNDYWNWSEHAEKLGTYLEPNIKSNVFFDEATGTMGVRKESEISWDQAYEAIRAGLDDNDERQLLAEYRAALKNPNIGTDDPGFKQYLALEVGKKAGLFTFKQVEIHSLRDLNEGNDKLNREGEDYTSWFGDGVFTGKSAAFTSNPYQLNLNNLLDSQLSEKVKELDKQIKAHQETLAQYDYVKDTNGGSTIKVRIFNEDTGQFEEQDRAVAYTRKDAEPDESGNQELTQEPLKIIENLQALRHERYILTKGLKKTRDAALEEAVAQLKSEDRHNDAYKLQKANANGSLDVTEFKTEVQEEFSNQVDKLNIGNDGAGPYYYLENGVIMRKFQGKGNAVKVAGPGDKLYEDTKAKAEREVKENNYAIGLYSDILDQKQKDQFAITTTFSKGLVLDVTGDAYKSLVETVNISADSFFFYDDASGQQIDQFGRNVLGDKKNFVPNVVYYNPAVKQWMIQGSLVPIDEKGNRMRPPADKEEYYKTYSISIQNLNDSILTSLYGKNNAEAVANTTQMFDQAFKAAEVNGYGSSIYLPIELGEIDGKLVASRGKDGSITGTYWDPNTKNYHIFTDKDINDFSNRYVQNRLIQTQYRAEQAGQRKQQVAELATDFVTSFTADPAMRQILLDEIIAFTGRETGGTYRPDIRNRAGSGATGIFQFMSTPNDREGYKKMGGKEFSLDEIANMSIDKQFAIWEDYYLGASGKAKVAKWVEAGGRNAFALYNFSTVFLDHTPSTTVATALKGTSPGPVKTIRQNFIYFGITREEAEKLDDAEIMKIANTITLREVGENIVTSQK